LKPGVYSVSCDKNVNDVIEMAGGLTENADTSVTNLAKKINNEMVIIIYTHEEVENSNIVDTVVKVIEKECVCPNIQNDSCINTEITGNIGEENGLVNINTATLEELMSVPGIGEAKARAIIEYRKNSVFLVLEDLLNVQGIGEKIYETIKVYLTT
jgi:competence protein ComEA